MKREGLNFILEMEDPEYDYFDDFYSDSNIEREKALFEKDIADDVEEIIDRYWNEDNIKEFAYYRESPSKDLVEEQFVVQFGQIMNSEKFLTMVILIMEWNMICGNISNNKSTKNDVITF